MPGSKPIRPQLALFPKGNLYPITIRSTTQHHYLLIPEITINREVEISFEKQNKTDGRATYVTKRRMTVGKIYKSSCNAG